MTLRIDPDAVLWSASDADRADRPLLLLLHGRGSEEADLFGLAPYLPLQPAIASLRAPLPFGPGYTWFGLDGLAGGDFTADAGELAQTTDAVLAWLDALDPKPTSVGLLGFSQGGALALELLRARPEGFAFAVVLAGFVIGRDEPRDAELATLKPPVFWGRGIADAVIPAASVRRTQEWLPAHSTLTERSYEGLGHNVSQAELDDVTAFLRDRYR